MDCASLSIIVEGNIGVGKSTFLEIISDHLDVQIVYEPSNAWQTIAGGNILENFYNDKARWAYSFQTFAFLTRVMEQERSLEGQSCIRIFERSVYSDRYCFAKTCFELGYMSELEWNLYEQCFDWFVEGYCKKPNAFIYLFSNPEICYERIRKRGRLEESGITLDYLEIIHNKHEQWFKKREQGVHFISDVPVLILQCNNDFVGDIVLQKQLIKIIYEFINSTFHVKIPFKNYPDPSCKTYNSRSKITNRAP